MRLNWSRSFCNEIIAPKIPLRKQELFFSYSVHRDSSKISYCILGTLCSTISIGLHQRKHQIPLCWSLVRRTFHCDFYAQFHILLIDFCIQFFYKNLCGICSNISRKIFIFIFHRDFVTNLLGYMQKTSSAIVWCLRLAMKSEMYEIKKMYMTKKSNLFGCTNHIPPPLTYMVKPKMSHLCKTDYHNYWYWQLERVRPALFPNITYWHGFCSFAFLIARTIDILLTTIVH